MTNKKSTKKALLMSALSLFVCVSMLIGSTFAWFTDQVTSANNIIKSGNLDVELDYWNGTGWKTVEDAADIIAGELWEPGYTEVAYLRLRNAGSLALKYQLGVNIISEEEGINKAGETFKLSDYIEYDVIEDVNGEENAYASREAAVAAVTDAKIISEGYTKADSLGANSEYTYLAMVVYMPTSVGNEANHNGTDVPQIDLGINLVATQDTVENDSFDNQYDDFADSKVTVETSEELTALLSDTELAGDITIMLTDSLTVDASVKSLPSGATYNFVSADGSDVSVTFAATTLNVTSDVNVDEGVTLNADMIHVKKDSDVVVSGTLDATEINLWHETKGETLTVTETGTLILDSSIAGYHDDAIIIKGTYTGKGIMIISGLIEITGENAKVTGTGDIQAVCESVLKITDDATVNLDGKISVYDNYANYYRTGTVVIDNATVTTANLRVNYENKNTAPDLDTMNMTITNGATVTVTNSATVYAGGNLYVSDGATLTAGTLTVKDGGVAEVDLTSTIDAATITGTVSAPVALTSETWSTTTIESNKTYALTGDFATANVSLVMAVGVENVVFDGTNATNINELIITQNGALIDNATSFTGDRSGKVTIQNFNVASQINVFAAKTEVEICGNTADALSVYAGNCVVNIHHNTFDANFETHSIYRDATNVWGSNDYGVQLRIFDYELYFDHNVVTDAKGHVVGLNGYQATFADIEADNVIKSFTGNTITVNSTTNNNRAAFKVWADHVYAPQDKQNSVNNAAQAFIDTVLADGSNTFNILDGYGHTIFCIYNVNTDN